MNAMQEAIKNAGVRKAIADSERTKKAEADQQQPVVNNTSNQVPNTTDEKPTPTIVKGKVKWFTVSKGYGFIVDENGNDVFVHFSGINNGRTYKVLDQGDDVEFEITEGKNGPQATNVNIIPA